MVLGPGSIVSASRVGCEFGYDLLWILPVACLLMIAMTITSMAIGVLQTETPCVAVANRFGRAAAFLVGMAMLVAITMFQASNNNAMLMAAEGFVGTETWIADSPPSRVAIPLAFNVGVIALLWASRRELYGKLETAMAILVGAMVLAFATNLVFAAPSITEIFRGLIPGLPTSPGSPEANLDGGPGAISWMTTGAMIATTFSVAAAFYQSYQVREKGWTESDLRLGIVDSLVGICALCGITMMILITAAAALHQVVPPSSLVDAAAVAKALEPTFGAAARYVFAAGVLAGAASSFVVNALIGAVVFCDSIGKSTKLSDAPVRIATIGVLLLGWLVSAIGVLTGVSLAEFIVIAQALTVVAFPVLALTLIWQATAIQHRLPRWVMPVNYIGLAVTILLSIRTVIRLTTG